MATVIRVRKKFAPEWRWRNALQGSRCWLKSLERHNARYLKIETSYLYPGYVWDTNLYSLFGEAEEARLNRIGEALSYTDKYDYLDVADAFCDPREDSYWLILKKPVEDSYLGGKAFEARNITTGEIIHCTTFKQLWKIIEWHSRYGFWSFNNPNSQW